MKEQVQQGVFMILCLRGLRAEMDRDRGKAVKQQLEAAQLSRRIQQVLCARQRRPIVEVEFPIVAGAQLEDVRGGADKLVEELRLVLGIAKRFQVRQHVGLKDVGVGERVMTLVVMTLAWEGEGEDPYWCWADATAANGDGDGYECCAGRGGGTGGRGRALEAHPTRHRDSSRALRPPQPRPG